MDNKQHHNNPAYVFDKEGGSRPASQSSEHPAHGSFQNQDPRTIHQPPTSYVYTQQPHLNQMTVVTQETVPDHFNCSLFVCLCCFWPLGLIGLIKAREARKLLQQGRVDEARVASEQAKSYNRIGLIIGIVLLLIVIGVSVWAIIFTVQTVDRFTVRYRY